MKNNFPAIAFTDNVKAMQEQNGSREAYQRMENLSMRGLFQREKEFIENRDGFYLSSVNENGWPYVQFRGGPKGFLKVLSPSQIGFADFRGNKQYITTGNLKTNNRVAIILMDYANQMRLKIWAESKMISIENGEKYMPLIMDDYHNKVERFIILDVKGFDWNCPQHITPRFTEQEWQLKNYTP